MPTKAKRNVYHLTWDAKRKEWVLRQEGDKKVLLSDTLKDYALDEAVIYAREHMPSQVKVHAKTGRIQFERTYGADPARHKG